MEIHTEDLIQIGIATLAGVTYIFFFFRVFLKHERRKKLRQYFYNSIIEIMKLNESTEKKVEKFDLINKKLIEKFPKETIRFRNSLEILEEIYTEINVIKEGSYKKRYKLSDDDLKILDKNNIMEMIEFLRKERPFSTLNSKEAHLLMNINNAIENNNVELGRTMLSQLSDNIELLESNLYTQEKMTKKSFVVAIIGLVLTIVFGISSLYPIIKSWFN